MVLFDAHSIEQAKEFCQRVIVIQHGKSLFSGSLQEATEFYIKQ